MNYDWEADKNFKEYLSNYKPSNDPSQEKEQFEMVKRNYYSTYVDKTFE